MSTAPKTIWAYTYRVVPPQTAARLDKVQSLIDEERRDAKLRSATWEGRLVVDERVAHILVLSDTPDLDRDVNRRIEAELRELDAGFSVTVPMAVVKEGSEAPPTDLPRGGSGKK